MQSLRVSNRNITLVMFYLTLATILFASGWFKAVPLHAQNEIVYNFENGEVGDWLAQGQVDIVSSYIDPQTANAMQTVAQGNFSVRIGDEVPWGMTGDQVSSIDREIIIPTVDAPV
ncbi:MAG: hypothetical protein EOM15_17480, partial [Spirochaetia bacterium]|nr:hypothetical protein [Spirochaetia bacterium]